MECHAIFVAMLAYGGVVKTTDLLHLSLGV